MKAGVYYAAWIENGDIYYIKCGITSCYDTKIRLTDTAYDERDFSVQTAWGGIVWSDAGNAGSDYGNYSIKSANIYSGGNFTNITTLGDTDTDNIYDNSPYIFGRLVVWQVGGAPLQGDNLFYSSEIYFYNTVSSQMAYSGKMNLGRNVTLRGLFGPNIVVSDETGTWYIWDVEEESGTVVSYGNEEFATGPVSINASNIFYVDSYRTIKYINLSDLSNRGTFYSYSKDINSISARSSDSLLFEIQYDENDQDIHLLRGTPPNTPSRYTIEAYNTKEHNPKLHNDIAMWYSDQYGLSYCKLGATGGCISSTKTRVETDVDSFSCNDTYIYWTKSGDVKRCKHSDATETCSDSTETYLDETGISYLSIGTWDEDIFGSKKLFFIILPVGSKLYTMLEDNSYKDVDIQTSMYFDRFPLAEMEDPSVYNTAAVWSDSFGSQWALYYFDSHKGYKQLLNTSCLTAHSSYELYDGNAVCTTANGNIIYFKPDDSIKSYIEYTTSTFTVNAGSTKTYTKTISGVDPTPNRIHFLGFSFKAYSPVEPGSGDSFVVTLKGRNGYPEYTFNFDSPPRGSNGTGGQWYDFNLANTPELVDFYLADIEGTYTVEFTNNASFNLYIRYMGWRFITEYDF